MKKKLLFILLVLFLFFVISCGNKYEIVEKELKGSKIMIIVPDNWNHKIIYYAHGYRAEDTPLHVDIDMDNSFYSKKVDMGWMIAATSYRRNGIIINDGIKDIRFLRDYIHQNYENIEKEYLIGSSMGGLIATLMAENDEYLDGVIANGAALQLDRENQLKYTPKVPLILLYNNNEKDVADEYLKKSKKSSLKPLRWYVKRRGHCRISKKEMGIAFSGLKNFENEKNDKNITQPVPIRKSVSKIKNNTIISGIKKINKGFNNADTQVVKQDLKNIGLKKGEYFNLICSDKKYPVYWGDHYNDVPIGDFVAFINMNGYLKIARNYADFLAKTGLKESDIIKISKMNNQPEKPDMEKFQKALKYNNEANEYLLNWNGEVAINLANKAIELYPDFHWFKLKLVEGYLLINKYDQALKTYDKYKDVELHTGEKFKTELIKQINDIKKEGGKSSNFDKFIEDIKEL